MQHVLRTVGKGMGCCIRLPIFGVYWWRLHAWPWLPAAGSRRAQQCCKFHPCAPGRTSQPRVACPFHLAALVLKIVCTVLAPSTMPRVCSPCLRRHACAGDVYQTPMQPGFGASREMCGDSSAFRCSIKSLDKQIDSRQRSRVVAAVRLSHREAYCYI